MVYEFAFPDVGEGISEGEIIKWHVKKGDTVKQDQTLVEIETDKAVVNIPSPTKGKITRLHAKEGATLKVGALLITIDDGKKGKTSHAKQEEKSGPGVVGSIAEASNEPVSGKLFLRKEGAQKAPKTVVQKKYDFYGYVERIPLKGIQKSVAKNLSENHKVAPLVTVMDEADVTTLWDVRKKAKEQGLKKNVHVTFLPFIMRAVLLALKKHPILNSEFDAEGEQIIVKKYYNFGIAVDTNDGLVVPVVKGVDQKNVFSLAKELEDLGKKARAKKLNLQDLKGSTFSITNWGSFGGTWATPVVNPPEAGILGMGRINERIVPTKDGVGVRKFLPLSVTFDHRVTDGANTAKFIETLKTYLQDPKKLS
ncbi:2-oxo acid dehydrogenase subunit E2 [archaeon CG10_big_fil_rev_8_21_14_0_10_43_11]|nr:MAG: 2-oxo acid dehydrogenase subunit E2 [archaeon CG10_big_fil_rev_8_21_14_0_10_43_11]